MSGGICRLKYHLVKIPGHDIDVCGKTTPKIMRIAFDSLEAKDKRKMTQRQGRSNFQLEVQ
jgi:hypothetical protein